MLCLIVGNDVHFSNSFELMVVLVAPVSCNALTLILFPVPGFSRRRTICAKEHLFVLSVVSFKITPSSPSSKLLNFTSTIDLGFPLFSHLLDH